MDLAKVVVLPLSALWALSEFGIFWATFSARQTKQHDRHSLALVIGVTTVAVAIALTLWWKGIGRIESSHPAIPLLGIAFVVAGLALRWTAILTLKRFFTINVAIVEGHQLITSRPYRFLRHPSYTGSLASLLGIAIALQNWWCLLVLVGVPLAAFLFRIRVEEAVLSNAFGTSYEDYCRRTSRLIPGVY